MFVAVLAFLEMFFCVNAIDRLLKLSAVTIWHLGTVTMKTMKSLCMHVNGIVRIYESCLADT